MTKGFNAEWQENIRSDSPVRANGKIFYKNVIDRSIGAQNTH